MQFGDQTDKLAQKVLFEIKTATSSLYYHYCLNLKKISKVNDYASVLDSLGNEICIIRIEKIKIIQFQNITETFAIEEEEDGNLENWLKIHTKYYSGLLGKIGKKLTHETELIREWFKVISPNDIK
nr:ASCH domain-containing protein [Sanguibacteroides sp. AM78-02pH3A]